MKRIPRRIFVAGLRGGLGPGQEKNLNAKPSSWSMIRG